MTYCDTLVLIKEDFDEVMVNYPKVFAALHSIVKGKVKREGWQKIRSFIRLIHAVRAFGGDVDLKRIFQHNSKLLI